MCDAMKAKLVTELSGEQLRRIIADATSKRYDSIRAEVDADGQVRIHLIYNTHS